MRTLYLAFCVSITIFSFNSKAQNTSKRYEIRSGALQYTTKTSGKLMGSTVSGSGKKSLYFKDFGAIELQEEELDQTTTTRIFGQSNTESEHQHTMLKLLNGKTSSVDFDQKLIYVNKDMSTEILAGFSSNNNAETAGKSMLKSLGGTKIGTEKILGYECEIWQLAGTKQWFYKGVLLKSEAKVMGITTTTEAQTAKFNNTVPDIHFQLPDFPIKNMGGFDDDGIDSADWSDMNEELDKIRGMSYETWKKHVLTEDNEMQELTEQELRATYDILQKVLKEKEN